MVYTLLIITPLPTFHHLPSVSIPTNILHQWKTSRRAWRDARTIYLPTDIYSTRIRARLHTHILVSIVETGFRNKKQMVFTGWSGALFSTSDERLMSFTMGASLDGTLIDQRIRNLRRQATSTCVNVFSFLHYIHQRMGKANYLRSCHGNVINLEDKHAPTAPSVSWQLHMNVHFNRTHTRIRIVHCVKHRVVEGPRKTTTATATAERG